MDQQAMIFNDLIREINYDEINSVISNAGHDQVSEVLKKDKINFNDFLILLSEAAAKLLPEIAAKARDITVQRFGRVINFYAPVYLSNECHNSCIYCGFNLNQNIVRKTLNQSEIINEFKELKRTGFDNILLLTGDAPQTATVEYICQAVEASKEYFTFTGLEIYAMTAEDYAKLTCAGADGLTIYQETYDREVYKKMHDKGFKRDYEFRLNAPERASQAGFRKIGLGALLGLSDWKKEALMLAMHVNYLQKKFWKTDFALSFPRIKPAAESFKTPMPVSDRDIVQMMCALRLMLPETGFLLSTRESGELRDKLIGLCITQISAGSKTNPGGYTEGSSGEQFEVSDSRKLEEMMEVVRKIGYEPVLKDWDKTFSLQK
jgi:2-iminoacetate synthase